MCPKCGGTTFERERDILDVWFDSGSSHEAVLPFREELTWPSDLYLEGSDQHRGWFQSSLLESCGTRGRAPYDTLLTHGFTMDARGMKMSKSLGNGVDPRDIIHSHGADALRFVMTKLATATQDVRLPVDMICPHCSETFQPKEITTSAGYRVADAIQSCPKCRKKMVSR